MAHSVVIVESPAKAKTIARFLGKDYRVEASFGHVRDLPENRMGANVQNDFEPVYVIPDDKRKLITNLKKITKDATNVILATDEDREGEAIAWHLAEAISLDVKKVQRIVFHEITETAIAKALKSPRTIEIDRVNAQQGRRILDRLVGYSVSPFLWKKIRKGLSAGRVQSVALRLVVDREQEITAFVPKEYWKVKATLSKTVGDKKQFISFLQKKNDKKIGLDTKATVDSILDELAASVFTVKDVVKKRVKRNPYPPFTTSTLQQDAARKLGFSAKKTMFLAQQLYEGIEIGSEGSIGLITYMRTDSLSIAEEAITTIRAFIADTLGKEYLPEKPNTYKTKAKGAQEAHEAIRPTSIDRTPKSLSRYLNPAQLSLYELIWKRTLACQTKQAELDTTSVSITAGTYTFGASGSTVAFDGFLKIYEEGKDAATEEELKEDEEQMLPMLSKGEELQCAGILPTQHFTKPPARFTEATLVKSLEEHGIGRPSTYAPIMSNIVDRGYVELKQKKFYPTDIGSLVSTVMVKHFPEIVDVKFTAKMEENLDKIAEGKLDYKKLLSDFYKPFFKLLQQKDKEVKKSDFYEETKELCEKCGKKMVVKFSRFGKFLACSGYPDCKNAKPLEGEGEGTADEITKENCPKCGAHLVLKAGRYGKFFGCSAYPECKFMKSTGEQRTLGIKCKACGTGDLIEKRSRRGKIFYGCTNYPTCKYANWNEPVNEECTICGNLKVKKRNGDVYCANCDG